MGRLQIPILSRLLQEVAVAHAGLLGVAVETLLERATAWVLSRMRLALVRWPQGGDEITIETWPEAMSKLIVERRFALSAGDGACIGTVSTWWVVLDLERRKPVRLPSEAWDRFRDFEIGSVPEKADKLALPDPPERELTFSVRRSDVDLSGHANNTSFVEWVMEAVPDEIWGGRNLTDLDVQFLAECHQGQNEPRSEPLWCPSVVRFFPARSTMRQARRWRALHFSLTAIGAVVLAACASSNGSSTNRDEAIAAADASRKTQQEVQSELMAFADRFFAGTLDAAATLENVLETPESRYTAAAARLVGLMVTTDIAASPNPGAALLDMTVFATLKRMVWEDYWMPEVYGEAGRPVLDSLRELEDDIWEIAAEVYTPEQLAEVEGLIDDWREQHPDNISVDFMRMSEIGDSRQVQTLVEAAQPGGLLAPVKEANRNLEEMRLLAERMAFMVTRMQLMISLQVEMASAKLAVQPEFRQLLEDSRTFAEVSDRAAEAFATLVADLPEERSAAIDQIMRGLSQERERIFADLGAEDGQLRPAVDDLRRTLEMGRDMAVELGETARDIDALTARMMAGSPNSTRPFDILEYQTTFAELTVTAQEIQAALTSIERILGSADIEEQMNPIILAANRLEDEVIDEILGRAFLYGVGLIFVFFALLTLHRWLVQRGTPPPEESTVEK